MIQTFLICVVTLIANNCETIHPDLNQLIPDYDHNPSGIKHISTDINFTNAECIQNFIQFEEHNFTNLTVYQSYLRCLKH